jgi:chemotaxis protein CheX
VITAISMADIAALTHDIWATMAGTDLVPTDQNVTLDKSRGYIVASVQIVGDTHYVVRLDLEADLVREAAGILLGVSPSELSHEELSDAAGELANMSGGSVKALLPDHCSLALPSVVIGTDYEFAVPSGHCIMESSFIASAGKMKLSILERRK